MKKDTASLPARRFAITFGMRTIVDAEAGTFTFDAETEPQAYFEKRANDFVISTPSRRYAGYVSIGTRGESPDIRVSIRLNTLCPNATNPEVIMHKLLKLWLAYVGMPELQYKKSTVSVTTSKEGTLNDCPVGEYTFDINDLLPHLKLVQRGDSRFSILLFGVFQASGSYRKVEHSDVPETNVTMYRVVTRTGDCATVRAREFKVTNQKTAELYQQIAEQGYRNIERLSSRAGDVMKKLYAYKGLPANWSACVSLQDNPVTFQPCVYISSSEHMFYAEYRPDIAHMNKGKIRYAENGDACVMVQPIGIAGTHHPVVGMLCDDWLIVNRISMNHAERELDLHMMSIGEVAAYVDEQLSLECVLNTED